MRILLDENVPIQLRHRLTGHEIASVNDATLGWKGIRNGVLLGRMEGRFDVLITADRNIYAQQNLSGRSFSILVLPSNRRKIVVEMAGRIVEALSAIRTGTYSELVI